MVELVEIVLSDPHKMFPVVFFTVISPDVDLRERIKKSPSLKLVAVIVANLGCVIYAKVPFLNLATTTHSSEFRWSSMTLSEQGW